VTSILVAVRISIPLLFVLAACGSEADPHVVGACDGWTDNQGNPFTGMCEAACRKPPMNTGKSCDTVVQLACVAFNFDSSEGCCIADGTTIRFYDCQ